MSDSHKLINIPKLFPDWVDNFLTYPIIFSGIVIFQGCFGGMGVVQTPKRLTKLINSPIARFLFLCCIAYTATTDAETAILTVVIFLLFLHFLRTPEERKELKSYF